MSNIRKGWGNRITVEIEEDIDIEELLCEIGKEHIYNWLMENTDDPSFVSEENQSPEDTAKLVATHIWREDDRKRFIEKFKEITGVL